MLNPRIVLSSILTWLSLAALPVFAQNVYQVADFHASGSTQTAYCSGTANSYTLTNCGISNSNISDFQPKQGIRIIGGGNPPLTAGFGAEPVVNIQNPNKLALTGGHTYCYVVSVADPFGGISKAYPDPILTLPSVLPSNCAVNEPAAFSATTIHNRIDLGGACPVMGPGSVFLWYVADLSLPNSSYKLFNIANTPGGGGCPYNPTVEDFSQASTFGTRGGWPASPLTQAKNEDFFTTLTATSGSGGTVAAPLPQSFQNLTVAHDDTEAVQEAINAAVTSNGGIVQFGNATYNIFRPGFIQDGSNYPAFGPSITASTPNDAEYSYIQIPNGATGHIYIAGVRSYASQGTTTINTPPDAGQSADFITIGGYALPCCYIGAPAYPPQSTFEIMPVAQGAKQITLASPSSALPVGTDIWLYSGSFGPDPSKPPCIDPVQHGNICHYSELNTVTSISTNSGGYTVLELATPASKAFYSDSYNDTFGLVKLPVTPHVVSLENITFNTFNPILSGGMVYGLTLTGLTINNPVGGGPFGHGYKRDVVIENSTWSFGRGDANVSFAGTDEFDQFTNVTFSNNTISGYSTPEVEGSGNGTRIYPTEGSSQFTFIGNTFNNVAVIIAQTTDDVFKNNKFNDGYIAVGTTYALKAGCTTNSPDLSQLSFNSSATVDIESNIFNIDDQYQPSYAIQSGAYDNATIANNTINYGGVYPFKPAMIAAASGNISGNIITVLQNSLNYQLPAPIAFCIQPSTTNASSPAAGALPVNIFSNTVNGAAVLTDVQVGDPGFANPPISCSKNSFNSSAQYPVINVNSNNTNVSCTQ